MISIITPVFNGERFIEGCIRNVIDQNCPEVEHVIVDGGSGDKTVEIIKKYAEKYPHIRWISEKDNGQSDAMNKGINLAQGEIISYLNVDDFYESGVINKIFKIFKTLPEPSFLVGNCKVLDNNGQIIYINKPAKLTLPDLLAGYPYPANPSAYFYHRSLHDIIGLYDVDDHYAMDLDFILRAVQVANIIYSDENWGNFRFIEGTKTYNDNQLKSGHKRVRKILRKYRNDLPPILRARTTIQYNILNVKKKIRLGFNKLKLN